MPSLARRCWRASREAWRDQRAEIDETGRRIAAAARRRGARCEPRRGRAATRPRSTRPSTIAAARLRRSSTAASRPARRSSRAASVIEFLLARGERRDGAAHAARDGLGRDVRPDRRRLRALLRSTRAGSIPHFEKMLYDNALLARAYLHGFQVSGEPFFERVCTRDARLGAARPAPGRRAASRPRSTPTPRASRASSTSGRRTSCARRSATRDADAAIAHFGLDRRRRTSRALGAGPRGDATRRSSPRSRRGCWRRASARVWPALDDKRLTALERADDLRARRRGRARSSARTTSTRRSRARSSSCASCATATAACCAPTTAARPGSPPTSRTTRSCSRRC